MAVKYVNVGYGYRLSKAATLPDVDIMQLGLELAVRKVLCEFPGCNDVAFTVMLSGVTAFICGKHHLAYRDGGPIAKAIEDAIKHKWQAISMVIINSAFEDADDHTAFLYTGVGDPLEQARQSISAADAALNDL